LSAATIWRLLIVGHIFTSDSVTFFPVSMHSSRSIDSWLELDKETDKLLYQLTNRDLTWPTSAQHSYSLILIRPTLYYKR